jgi:hypothetical protein
MRLKPQTKASLLLLICALPLTVTGCSRVKDELGLTRRSPDEFAVVRRAPLEMPPDLRYLPPPNPGAPRPQEMSPSEIAKASLLGGDPAAKPQSMAATPGATLDSNDASFLNQLGATGSDPNIRRTVDTEAVEDADNNRSAIQKLMGKKGETEGQVLNPMEENQRLQKQGAPTIAVPADPKNVAPVKSTPALSVPPIQ